MEEQVEPVEPVFRIGTNNNPSPRARPSIQSRTPPNFMTPIPTDSFFAPMTYDERCKTPPKIGRIRLFIPMSENYTSLNRFWYSDMSYTEWSKEIQRIIDDISSSSFTSNLYPYNAVENIQSLFFTNQQIRYLAFKVLRKWSQRVWMKRTQCNVDLIENEPVKDRNAVYITDTKQRMIFKFDRSDIFTNLITNISSSDEMMPYPRNPTNPWTNQRLTYAQTMSLCQQLMLDYAKRGKCPPVLFAAFCEARYSIRNFLVNNPVLLGQHAIMSYFKEFSPQNIDVIVDTAQQLLSIASVSHYPVRVERWLRSTPVTPLHREWLEFVRDYTLYINLHVQIRPSWRSMYYVMAEIAHLYSKTQQFVEERRVFRPRRAQPEPVLQPTDIIFSSADMSITAELAQLITDTIGIRLISYQDTSGSHFSTRSPGV